MVELNGILERVTGIARILTARAGFELVHCQIAGTRRSPVVRIFIDKAGGVSVEDCAVVSREMEAILDREDFIPTSYVLEVSSPGIERELFTIEDFKRFTGQNARVRMARSIDGQRNFTGMIVGTNDRIVEFEDRTRGRVEIPYDAIAKANLMVDLRSEFKKA